MLAVGGFDMAGSVALAQEFRAAIEALRINFADPIIQLTASFGVVSAIPHPTMRPQDFLAHADKALYQAKADGRNCVRACAIPAAIM